MPMLAEFAVYLTTPAGRSVRRSGALRDAVSLWARGRRCRTAWMDHEARTKAAFHRAIEGVAGRGTVVVLGSGMLRDVPIERLAAEFARVVLVDIVHLSPVRLALRLSGARNVELMTRDLSGYDELLQRARIGAATGQDEIGGRLDPLGFVRRMDGVDLVLSANLLSQIGVGAEARMRRPDGGAVFMPDDTVARLISAHLDSLAALPCRTCLVTDVSYVVRDREGGVVESRDLMHGVEPPDADAEWDWPVAPFGEEGRDTERVHHVIAVQDVAFDLY
jgi:hypothetical protein